MVQRKRSFALLILGATKLLMGRGRPTWPFRMRTRLLCLLRASSPLRGMEMSWCRRSLLRQLPRYRTRYTAGKLSWTWPATMKSPSKRASHAFCSKWISRTTGKTKAEFTLAVQYLPQLLGVSHLRRFKLSLHINMVESKCLTTVSSFQSSDIAFRPNVEVYHFDRLINNWCHDFHYFGDFGLLCSKSRLYFAEKSLNRTALSPRSPDPDMDMVKYRFASPAIPGFELPAAVPWSPGDIRLNDGNPIVEPDGTRIVGFACNGDQVE